MTAKERLHELIEGMNDDQAAVLLLDLEQPDWALSEDDLRAIDAGRRDAREGRIHSTEDVVAYLRSRR